ncbi:type II toxin-antitoxin system VapC family toxin [Microbacterium sp.]|uniref:type II toxin-antitoxin system VapC family toxin n=1 Tax=Microbacterium sp. TaxID=51671 RepID=UPI003F95F6D6
MLSYFDTSAAAKMILREEHSDSLFDELAGDVDRVLVASWLLHTELHCAVARRGSDMPLDRVDDVLQTVRLVDLSRQDMIAAARRAPLRAADAIHLAVALRLACDEVITYDVELANAALRAGLRVSSPGL